MMSLQVTVKMVGELRGRTGAGLLDCKKALTEAEGDMDEAMTILRKKGVASAAAKAGRTASEGLVGQYVHLGGKVGVLVEVNCETDFVAKTEAFKTLTKDICLHIAASNPQYISREDVPDEVVGRERDIAAAQVAGKPAHIVQTIVEGKMDKVYQSICLLEQPFVRNPEQSVRGLLNEQIAKLGENIVLRRFTRYQLGD